MDPITDTAVTTAAVVAAAKVLFVQDYHDVELWDRAGQAAQRRYLKTARVALEAALPALDSPNAKLAALRAADNHRLITERNQANKLLERAIRDRDAYRMAADRLNAGREAAVPLLASPQPVDEEPVTAGGLSELERYAADLVHEHARDVELLTVREMAGQFLERTLTDDEARHVHDLIGRAEIVVGFPGTTEQAG